MGGSAPSLSLQLLSETGVAVQVHNGSDAPARLWEPGNSWGDAAWWFELIRAQGPSAVRRLPQSYTRDVPSWREVGAGATSEWDFDLGDGTWELDATVGLSEGQLVAVYEAPPTPEAEKQHVLTGPLRSEPVDIA